jgi:hypothetical protein
MKQAKLAANVRCVRSGIRGEESPYNAIVIVYLQPPAMFGSEVKMAFIVMLLVTLAQLQ